MPDLNLNDDCLPASWFRISLSSEVDLPNVFSSHTHGIPSHVLLMNDEPFAYFDITQKEPPITARLWVPGWNESLDISGRAGGMAVTILNPLFNMLEKHNANNQQAAGLAFTCHKICEEILAKSWQQSDNLTVFREVGDTSTTMRNLANASLHEDIEYISSLQKQAQSNIVSFMRAPKSPWTQSVARAEPLGGTVVPLFPRR